MKLIKYYIQLLSLIILVTSCSNISNKNIEDLKNMHQLKVEIAILNALETKTIDGIMVTLYDANDKLVGNDSLQVLMNDKPMTLSGNYAGYYSYDRYYLLRKQSPETQYQFKLMFPDSTLFNLGSITPKPTELNRRLTIAKQINKPEAIVMTWSDLSHLTHVDLKMYYEDSTDASHYTFKTETIDLVTTKQRERGNFILSKEQLRDSSLVIKSIKSVISEKQSGLLLQNLLEGSSCYFTNSLTQTTDVILTK